MQPPLGPAKVAAVGRWLHYTAMSRWIKQTFGLITDHLQVIAFIIASYVTSYECTTWSPKQFHFVGLIEQCHRCTSNGDCNAQYTGWLLIATGSNLYTSNSEHFGTWELAYMASDYINLDAIIQLATVLFSYKLFCRNRSLIWWRFHFFVGGFWTKPPIQSYLSWG